MVRSTLIVSLLAAASAALAQTTDGPAKTIIPGAYIFELEDNHDPSDFLDKVNAEGTTRMELNYKLFKGLSVQLTDLDNAQEKAMKIAEMPVVKSVWPVQLINAPNPRVEWVATPQTQAAKISSRGINATTSNTFSPHVMTQVDKLRAKGITGKGIKVAVVDTGIDYKHPALGGCFGPGCLVSFGTDLVGDDYNGNNTPHPGPDPMDCGGHGTHVAGIIAAQTNQYGFSGVAPDVGLGAYRVFGCTGQAGNDVLIAAFNKAYEDGANIITASIGGPSGWSEDPWAVAVSRIVDAGVPCTVAAGNAGNEGLFYASTAANGKRVTAIASVDNTETPTVFSVSDYSVDGGETQEFGYVPAEPEKWDEVKLPLWAGNFDTTVANDACNPLPANTPDLSGYIVLVRRGTCTFVQKAQNVAAKGAKYIIVYNTAAGAIPIDVTAVRQIVSAGMVEAAVGESWVKRLKDNKKVVLSMTGAAKAVKKIQSVDNPTTGGALSLFTTWGPTWELDVKPQFSAPGGNILSTYPLALGGYATLSGTSMATPLTAGVVALIAQVRGTFDPELIENLLSANANPQLFNDGSQFYSFLAPVAQQGGGLIQAYDAAYATTLLSHSSLAFNDTEHFVPVRNFTISNTGNKQITYRLSHVPADTFYTLPDGSVYPAPFPNDAVAAYASLQISETEVTLDRGEAATIEILPIPPVGLNAQRLPVWSGYVAINGTDGTSLSIPYQGLAGSLRNHTVLAPKDTWISKSTDPSYRPIADNVAFTLPAPGKSAPAAILPELVVNLALGSRFVRADIVPMTTCPPNSTTEFFGTKTIGQPAGYPALWSTRGIAPIPWNGQLNNGDYAPPGKYKFVVRALRIFGDVEKQEDWDVSETTSFRIKYE